MILFFKRMPFGNNHELIIKCLMFSFSVISYLSFLPFAPCFVPVFYKYHGTLQGVTALIIRRTRFLILHFYLHDRKPITFIY